MKIVEVREASHDVGKTCCASGEALPGKSIRIALIGPTLLCDALATLISDFDDFPIVIDDAKETNPVQFKGEEDASAMTSAVSSAVDVWILLSSDAEHLNCLLTTNGIDSEFSRNRVEPHHALLVALIPLVSSTSQIRMSNFISPTAKPGGQWDASVTLLRAAAAAEISAFISINDSPAVLKRALIAAFKSEPYCSVTLTPWLIRALQGPKHGSLPHPALTSFFPPHSDRVHCVQARPWELSERENDVATYAAEGLSNRAIAQQMFVSVNTVKTHLKQIFRKARLTSRSQLAAQWRVANQECQR